MHLYKTFDSPEEYADYLDKAGPQYSSTEYSNSWAGCSREDAIKTLHVGDASLLHRAQAIIDKLDLAHIFSNDVPVLQPSIAGFIPNVPAAIAGQPEAMFRRGFVESPSILAPLTVYVDTTVSAGVSEKQLIERGIAVLAFVLAMETVRPVDLYCISLGTNPRNQEQITGSVTKIASRPMDISRAVWMLTSPGYSRRCRTECQYYQHKQKRDPGNWIFGIAPTDKSYEPTIRKLLELQPDDVFMKGGHLFDSLMLNDPVEWVRQMIAKHSGGQE